jgi:hypothetical protein
MKVIITENKVFDTIYRYFDRTFNPNEIDWVYGPNEEGDDWQENPENENFLMFYKGDYQGEYDSDVIFHYFDVDFYDKNDPSHKPFRNQAPILEVIGEYGKHLDTMFDNHWEEPMKKWFQDNFNLPVKTVSAYYDYENYN